MIQRHQAITELTSTLNTKFTTKVTDAQVEHWVGCGANIATIEMYSMEVDQNVGVMPNDILSIWNDCDPSSHAEKLWTDFTAVPINDDDTIDIPFLHFEKGTYRFDIWHWFEQDHNVRMSSVAA